MNVLPKKDVVETTGGVWKAFGKSNDSGSLTESPEPESPKPCLRPEEAPESLEEKPLLHDDARKLLPKAAHLHSKQ